ncbi:MAG: Hsp20/alpha crystallin family protein [Candidatus Nitrohelix vancouverensis]|uniref:Hsp20/alpha crystallin family protein n=1 Tax=Candidatus Nitrohelix vancouverensis TaxID=2705534 RepID=A0A7T0C4I2_9BACT|nr:MAG: Hsp20/alpha crystallin family protein [Candidatus Nitrohelix vancouverensis]
MKIKDLIPWSREKEMENPFAALQNEMNRLFNNFSSSGFNAPFFNGENGTMKEIYPNIDLLETEKEFIVNAELPGIDEKDVDVKLTHNQLIIKGEKKEEKFEEEKNGYVRTERSFGSFYRSIPVPAGIDPQKINAEFKKGVLKVTLGKSKEAQEEVVKIPIHAVN